MMLDGYGIQWFKTSLQVRSTVQLRLARLFPLVGCKSGAKKVLMLLEAIH